MSLRSCGTLSFEKEIAVACAHGAILFSLILNVDEYLCLYAYLFVLPYCVFSGT